jgi:multisubunit Na+/H+ antiporter MnhB subunit
MNGFSSDPHAHLHLSLWPSDAGALTLSVVTFLLCVLLYRGRATVERWQRAVSPMMSAHRVWDATLENVGAFASWYSERWQNGSLRWYFSATLLFSFGLFAVALEQTAVSFDRIAINLGNLTWQGAILCALIVAASLLVVRARTRLAGAISLTAVGFLVALMYVEYRSPDIVLTQILIETVSTIFILLVLFFMPAFRRDGFSPAESAWNFVVSSAAGILMFMLVLLCTSPSMRETANLGATYLERSLIDGGGSNAVNVIIVDIRAMDTTGEITVLVVVGLCIFGLLRARRARA